MKRRGKKRVIKLEMSRFLCVVDIVKWRRRGGKMKEESGNELFGRIKMKRKFKK